MSHTDLEDSVIKGYDREQTFCNTELHKKLSILTAVARWVGCHPANLKVTNSIMPGFWARLLAGGVQEATNRCFSAFLHPFLLSKK